MNQSKKQSGKPIANGRQQLIEAFLLLACIVILIGAGLMIYFDGQVVTTPGAEPINFLESVTSSDKTPPEMIHKIEVMK